MILKADPEPDLFLHVQPAPRPCVMERWQQFHGDDLPTLHVPKFWLDVMGGGLAMAENSLRVCLVRLA